MFWKRSRSDRHAAPRSTRVRRAPPARRGPAARVRLAEPVPLGPPTIEERVQACVDRRRARPERFPSPLVALLLLTYVRETTGDDPVWSESWFEEFFGRWLPSRSTFPEHLAPHVVEAVVDIVEELVESGLVAARGLELARDESRWSRDLTEALRRGRSHLA